jgi:hypothetical protein
MRCVTHEDCLYTNVIDAREVKLALDLVQCGLGIGQAIDRNKFSREKKSTSLARAWFLLRKELLEVTNLLTKLWLVRAPGAARTTRHKQLLLQTRV